MGEGRFTMLSMLRCTRMTRTLATRSFRSTPAMFEKLPAQPDSFPAGELINEITGANGLRREEIEAQAQGLERFEGEWSGPVDVLTETIWFWGASHSLAAAGHKTQVINILTH